MTLYMIRFGDPGRAAHARIDAYVEGGDPHLFAAMRLLENWGCPAEMAQHIEVRNDGKGGAVASVRYSRDPNGLDYTFGVGDETAEAVAQVADHEHEKYFGGPDLWAAERWEEIYRHEAKAARRAFQDAEWQRDRDIDIANGHMPDFYYRF